MSAKKLVELLPASEAAEAIGVSTPTLYSLVRRKLIPSPPLVMISPQRGIRFEPDALKAWLLSGGLAAAQKSNAKGSEATAA